MHLLRLEPPFQLAIQFAEAGRAIGKVLSRSLFVVERQYIQPVFAHIDAHIAVHRLLSSWLILTQRPANLVCKLSADLSQGFRYRPTSGLVFAQGRDSSQLQTFPF